MQHLEAAGKLFEVDVGLDDGARRRVDQEMANAAAPAIGAQLFSLVCERAVEADLRARWKGAPGNVAIECAIRVRRSQRLVGFTRILTTAAAAYTPPLVMPAGQRAGVSSGLT